MVLNAAGLHLGSQARPVTSCTFRSPIGDQRITSAIVDDLPTAWGLEIRAEGSLDEEGGSPFPFRRLR
jgi:hypothetical protein